MQKAVLFDLDGTLIDHFQCIYRCYRHALDHLGLPPVTYQEVKSAVGGSIAITFGKFLPQNLVPQAVSLYRELFDQIWQEDLIALKGSLWILEQLKQKNVRTAVFTNKEGDRSRLICAHIGFTPFVQGIYGTLDTPYKKPDPEFTHFALDKLNATPETACLIGDSPYDAETAQRVGMPCYLVATGTHEAQWLKNNAPCEGVYSDLIELGTEVFHLTPPTP